MNNEELCFLPNLINRTNRSKNQTLFLYELCDNDLFKLLEVEEKTKNNYLYYCCGDKEELDNVLSMSNNDNKFKLNDIIPINDIKGKDVTIIGYPFRGKIVQELISENNKFEPQFGVHWYSGKDGKEHSDNLKNYGMPNYWINKNNVIITL